MTAPFKGRRFLVTGATGLLGSNLARELLKNGAQVLALIRKQSVHPLLEGLDLAYIYGDIRIPSTYESHLENLDGVFHTAGRVSYSSRDQAYLTQLHVDGTQSLIERLHEFPHTRLVYTSSTAAIGIPEPGQIGTEESPFLPQYQKNPYMSTKNQGETLVRDFAQQGGNAVIVNPATIIGAGDMHMNMGRLITAIAQQRIHHLPPGKNSFVSVKNCVTGHLLAYENAQPGQRYILAQSDLSYCDLAHILDKIKVSKHIRPIPYSPKMFWPIKIFAWLADHLGHRNLSSHLIDISFRDRCFSSQKAQSELGWRPSQPIEEAVQEAIDFYKAQLLW
ncbi:MAG: hypothetical protein CL521_00710 [Actinobacteria bacterium]|nr:hypothetical protein [Actinomycetota bacterium]